MSGPSGKRQRDEWVVSMGGGRPPFLVIGDDELWIDLLLVDAVYDAAATATAGPLAELAPWVRAAIDAYRKNKTTAPEAHAVIAAEATYRKNGGR